MEALEKTDDFELLELQRFAAASLASFTRTPSVKLHDGVFCNSVDIQDHPAVEIPPPLYGLSGDVKQPVSALLREAEDFQFFYALQEAQQHIEAHSRDAVATSARPTELQAAARKAVSGALRAYLQHNADVQSGSTAEEPSGGRPPNPEATAGAGGSDTSAERASKEESGEEHSGDEVAPVSDAEIEAWKWEAIGADSEAPTDTEWHDDIQARIPKTTCETFGHRTSDVEENTCAPGRDAGVAGPPQPRGRRGEMFACSQADAVKAYPPDAGTATSAVQSFAQRDAQSARAEVETMPRKIVSPRAAQASLVGQEPGASVAAVPAKQVLHDPSQPFAKGVPLTADATERQSLFSSAGGIRRRRGRRAKNTESGHRIGSPTSDLVAEKDKEDDVAGQLLGLAQEMKVEATRFGEVLQRDNERLQRTGEAQQQCMDDTEGSTRQTRSLVKGTGFGFLYAMTLLVIACALFVFMLGFILFVRG